MKIYRQVTTNEEVGVDSAEMLYAVTEEYDYSGNTSEKIIALFQSESYARVFVSTLNSNISNSRWFNIVKLAGKVM